MSPKRSPTILTLIAGISVLLNTACASQPPTQSPQTRNTPVTQPPVTQSPVTQSPVTQSPVTQSLNTPPTVTPTPSITQSASVTKTSPPSSPQVSSPITQPTTTKTVTPQPKENISAVVITAPDSGCRISQAKIADPDGSVNVRSAPEVTNNNIVGQLKNNSFVSVKAEQNGWFNIDQPAGWIAKNRTKYSCSQVNETIKFPPGGSEAIIKGEIIGGGTHIYQLQANQGQTLRVINNHGLFPMIIAPNGKILIGNPYTDPDRKEWTAQLPASGNYTFQFDSNFKGFDYDFSVQVK
ncbi:MAG: SH3 domain-containing protein [Microcoleaceae cyanobacterium]